MLQTLAHDPPELMETGHAARVLGISSVWLRHLADQGVIPHLKLSNGRRVFALADVERFVQQRSTQKSTVS